MGKGNSHYNWVKNIWEPDTDGLPHDWRRCELCLMNGRPYPDCYDSIEEWQEALKRA